MFSLPLNLHHLPLTLQTILANCDEIHLDLSGQLSNLNPQDKQNILESIFTHFPLLSALHLGNNNLETLPDSISHLTQLTYLYLSHNKLNCLPDTFGNLIQLTQLDLSHNQLTHFTETFGHLTQLTQLYLHHNQLNCLPDSLDHLIQLTHLNLHHNQLTSLTETLGHLTQLTYLNLHRNKLHCLPNNLGNLSRLTSLNLSGNLLTSLPETLGNLTQLTQLELQDNNLASLTETLGKLTRLGYLNVDNNQITRLPISAIKLPDNMQCHSNRHHLNFLPDEWTAGYTGVFKLLKEYLRCILSLDEIKQAKNFCSYSSLSQKCYHLIIGKHLASEESPPNVTAESSTKRIKYPQKASSQAPAPNSLSTSQPLPESPPEFHYFSQLPHDLSKKILLHAATIPTSHHPQFMKGLRKHLSDKLSFNSIQCFLEEAVPNWREKVRQRSGEIQKTSIPYR